MRLTRLGQLQALGDETLSSVFTLWSFTGQDTCSAWGRKRGQLVLRGTHSLSLISEIVKSHVLEQEWRTG